MKTQDTYDIAIIGAGPGGYVAAVKAPQMGARALLIEKEKLGGTCVNWGCIPTKALLADVKPLCKIKRSEVYGGNEHLYPNLEKMVRRKNRLVESMTKGIEALLSSNGVQLVYGSGCLVGPKTIRVSRDGSTEIYSAGNIVLAPGSQAATLSMVSPDKKIVLSSKEILNIQRIPKDIIIIGGGSYWGGVCHHLQRPRVPSDNTGDASFNHFGRGR